MKLRFATVNSGKINIVWVVQRYSAFPQRIYQENTFLSVGRICWVRTAGSGKYWANCKQQLQMLTLFVSHSLLFFLFAPLCLDSRPVANTGITILLVTKVSIVCLLSFVEHQHYLVVGLFHSMFFTVLSVLIKKADPMFALGNPKRVVCPLPILMMLLNRTAGGFPSLFLLPTTCPSNHLSMKISKTVCSKPRYCPVWRTRLGHSSF